MAFLMEVGDEGMQVMLECLSWCFSFFVLCDGHRVKYCTLLVGSHCDPSSILQGRLIDGYNGDGGSSFLV